MGEHFPLRSGQQSQRVVFSFVFEKEEEILTAQQLRTKWYLVPLCSTTLRVFLSSSMVFLDPFNGRREAPVDFFSLSPLFFILL